MIIAAVRPYYGFQGRYWKTGETVELASGSVYPVGSFRIVKEDASESPAAEEKTPKTATARPAAKKKK